MARLGRAMRRGAAIGGTASASSYVPTNFGFKYLYWAGGPETLASNPTDDTTQQYFYDEKNLVDLQQTDSTKRPKWKATAGPGGKPAWLFDGTNDYMPGTISVSGTVGWTIVVVGIIGAADRALWGNSAGNTYMYQNGTDWSMQGGPNVGGHGGHATAIDANKHLFSQVVTTTKMALEVDGTPQRSNQSGEAPYTLSTIQIGSMHPTYYFSNSYISLWGVYEGGDARDVAGWQAFEDWCETQYGLTVA